MRTTLTIDSEVLAAFKRQAAETHRSLSGLIEAALREHLARQRDTLAIGQAEAPALARILLADAPSAVGAPTLAEAALVLQARLGPQGVADLHGFLIEFDVHAIPFGDQHWRQAGTAFARYGKGRHPAGLSFGDCLTYAVAKLSGQPLLCVGGDFSQTDLRLVPLPDR